LQGLTKIHVGFFVSLGFRWEVKEYKYPHMRYSLSRSNVLMLHLRVNDWRNSPVKHL
jgi:hypothetical protein